MNDAHTRIKLGDVIGKGAFGVVFKALNWTTGETVAVKQIGLSNIPQSELPEIMSEINLLKNLNHPNIVQYRGSTRNAENLYIILEYCENGSLHNICKRFGKFPEGLVAQYICQVLDGLLYLHEQGVIHRDIKGSNILATKEGSVKLADFGVATRAGPLRDSAVVGSPYWMAPEVIDQSGATTASDIWSVGAVVIELLEGNPPYHDLDPMPALFRIVNDDCPPIPDTASAAARDFLLECFQKDCRLRISARKLLKHPWMLAARRQLEQTKREQLPRSLRPPNSYDETVNKVQEFNKALEATAAAYTGPRLHSRPSVEVVQALQARPAKSSRSASSNLAHLSDLALSSEPSTFHDDHNFKTLGPRTTPVLRSIENVQPAKVTQRVQVGEEDDNWDEDFAEGISKKKIAALDPDQNTAKKEHVSKHSHHKQAVPPVVTEDYSDMLGDGTQTITRPKVYKSSLQPISRSSSQRILHPRDLSALGNAPMAGPTRNKLEDRDATIKPKRTRSRSKRSHLSSHISQYREIPEEEDDFSDLVAHDASPASTSAGTSLQLADRLSGKAWLGDGDSDEEDPFADVDEADSGRETADADSQAYRAKLGRQNLVVKVVEALASNECPDVEAAEQCIKLIDAFEEDQELCRHFIKVHGLLNLLEALQFRKGHDTVAAMLRVLNIVVADDTQALEKLCLVGGIPIVLGFATNRHSRDIRLEAALFIGTVCHTSILTLQMFISCRGSRVLIDLMDESYRDQKDLIWVAVDAVLRVFEMQTTTPRSDFCRLFVHEGLLLPLASALVNSAEDDDELAQSANAKISQIFFLFAQSDLWVRETLAQRPIVTRLAKSVALLKKDALIVILKTIKNISMSPKALDVLQNANMIEVLVKQLITAEPSQTEIFNPIVNTLYNLCQLSKARQEEAASLGVIPPLMTLVQNNSPLKQFALPILCDLPQNSKLCRKMLWQQQGLDFYLQLLKDPFWSSSALDGIAAWLKEEPQRVEDVLVRPASVEAFVKAFTKCKAGAFEKLLEPYLKIVRISNAMATVLGQQAAFMTHTLHRLESQRKPVVRSNLLRFLKAICDGTPISARSRFAKLPDLLPTIHVLAESDSALMVRQIASELEHSLQRALHQADKPHTGIRRSNSTAHGLSQQQQPQQTRPTSPEVLQRLRTSRDSFTSGLGRSTAGLARTRTTSSLGRSSTSNNLRLKKSSS